MSVINLNETQLDELVFSSKSAIYCSAGFGQNYPNAFLHLNVLLFQFSNFTVPVFCLFMLVSNKSVNQGIQSSEQHPLFYSSPPISR